MELTAFFKSVLDSDTAPVVLCDLNHTIVYMNPASIKRYKRDLTGSSLRLCHNEKSNEMIDRVLAWFQKSRENNTVFTFRNDGENKDVYMIALRDETGNLIGYYEKHCYRACETGALYDLH